MSDAKQTAKARICERNDRAHTIWYSIEDGPYAGGQWVADPDDRVRHRIGEVTTVTFYPADQFAREVR